MAKTETLEARIGFRLPMEVANDWRKKAKASGGSLSDWLRGLVDANQKTGLPTPGLKRKRDTSNDCDPELMRQLAQIGNNLNQVARALNECRKVGDAVQVVEVLSVLRSIEEAIAELYPQLPRPPSETRSPETVARSRERAGNAH
jgi:hypothetical protein